MGTSAGNARADDAVRLDYRAPVGCPESDAFIERVRQRVPTARSASPDELARELRIVVGEDEDGFSARLDFVDVRGETITRTLAGKTCDEVVTGIALVTALALEAQREGAGGSAEGAAPADAADATASGEGTPPDAAPAEPAEPARKAPKPVLPPPPASPAPRPALPAAHLTYGAGVGGGNAWYVAPGTPLAFDAAFRVGHSALTGSTRAGFRSWVSDERVGSRSATFVGFAGALELCPVAWPVDTPVRFEPCLGGTLGVLQGEGDRSNALPVTSSKSILWADLRGILRIRVVLTTQVELEAQGEIGVPLRSHRFLFQSPEETVFDVPAFGPGWRAGVMLHFP